MPTYQSLPPLDTLPEPVVKVAQELLDLRVRKADLSREEAELTRQDGRPDAPRRASERADAELLASAARAGKDLSKVGTPNADKLEAAIKQNATAQRAVKTALDQVSNELHATLMEHFDAASADAGERLSSAGEVYVQAIDAMTEARRQYLQVEAITRFLDTAAEGKNSLIGYNPNISRPIRVGRSEIVVDAVIEALNREATGQPARPRHYTTGPGFDAA